MIAGAVRDRGELDIEDQAASVGGRSWGPGQFRGALRETLGDRRLQLTGRRRVGPPNAGQTR